MPPPHHPNRFLAKGWMLNQAPLKTIKLFPPWRSSPVCGLFSAGSTLLDGQDLGSGCDLKPENILLGSNSHACLSDFGLSKDFVGVPAISFKKKNHFTFCFLLYNILSYWLIWAFSCAFIIFVLQIRTEFWQFGIPMYQVHCILVCCLYYSDILLLFISPAFFFLFWELGFHFVNLCNPHIKR